MEKQASNFELNVIKLGIHTIHLQKGDRFETNGGYFNYVPSTKENQGKGSYRRWEGRGDNLSAKKYKKDVLRADNIELIQDKLIYPGTEAEALAEEEERKAEGWKAGRLKVYEVKYTYKVEIPKNEQLILLSIELGGRWNDEENADWKYNTQELEVKRVTELNLFLEKSHPITYHSQIPKTELDNVQVSSNRYYILCFMDKFHEAEAALFARVEKGVLGKIENGHEIVRRETNNLSKFHTLKSKHGY